MGDASEEPVAASSTPHQQLHRVMTAFNGLLESKGAVDEAQNTSLGRGSSCRHLALDCVVHLAQGHETAGIEQVQRSKLVVNGIQRATRPADCAVD